MNIALAISNLRHLIDASDSVPRWSDGGELMITVGPNGLNPDVLKALEDNQIFSDFDTSAPSVGTVTPGTEIVFRHVNQAETLIIAPDLAGLLAFRKAKDREPNAYLLWNNKDPLFFTQGSPIDTIPEPVKSYHHAVRLWILLCEYAHYQDRVTKKICFFGIRKTEIAPNFNIDDLANPVDVSMIEAFVRASDAIEIRKEILASRISHHLKDQDPDRNFSFLLRTTGLFTRGLKEAMSIYLSEHSPEKLADEATKVAVDFTEKVEKIVGGLETKSLTIPAAVLLAYKEVDLSQTAVVGNIMIVFSTILYLAAMLWVWYTQGTLLDLLCDAIDKKRTEFEQKGLDKNNPVLKETFTKLKDRVFLSEKFAGAMAICSAIPLIAGVTKWIFS